MKDTLINEIKKEYFDLRDCSVKISAINVNDYLLEVYKHEPELTIIDDAFAVDSHSYNIVVPTPMGTSDTQSTVVDKSKSVLAREEPPPNVREKKLRSETIAKCKICSKFFCRGSVLKSHLETHKKDRHHFECDVCAKKITNKHGFIRHFLGTHRDDKPHACKSCPKKFGLRESLEKHSKTHTALRKFKCEVCLLAFMDRSVLKTHMKKHLRQPVTCKLCGRRFETQNWLNFHLKFTNHNKTYTCDVCGRAIKGKNSLKRHLRSHQPEMNFECNVCFRKFKFAKLLSDHIRRLNHTDPANATFKCTLCPKVFITKNGLDEHRKIHFDGTHYTCHICPKKYSRSNKLRPHLMDKHIEPITRFKCELCSETFQYEVTLKTHLANHITTPVEHKCRQCAKEFSKASDLRVHEISHKPLLKCEFCYRSFRLPIIMDMHLEIHDEILYKSDDRSNGRKRLYSCDLCSAVVESKIGIWKHLKSHTQSFQCEYCLKTFDKKCEQKFRSHLRQHIMVSMQTQKNHQCENCLLEFDSKTSLEDHVLKYHKSKLYKSKYCSKQFGSRFRCSTHNKEHISKQRRQCNDCSQCIPANDYAKHEQLHAEGKQPYSKYIATFWTCNQCKENLTTNDDLRNHLTNVHQMEFPLHPSKWKCDICGDEMYVWGLLKHLRKVHGRKFLQATKKWKCIDCSIECLSYGGVHKHMKKFHAERLYK